MRKVMMGVLLGLTLLFGFGIPVSGSQSSGTDEDTSLGEELLDQLDMQELDDYLKQNEETEDISFAELVTELMTEGGSSNYTKAVQFVKNLLFKELSENKQLLIIIVALAAAFALLKNFSSLFKNSYISDLCFILVYIELMVLLMKSFLIMHELLNGTLEKVVDFMKMVLPVYCLSMVFSNGTGSAAGFYEMAYLIIFLVQWVILYVLAPLIQIFVAMEFINYILEGEKFTRMCELLEGIIQWGMKIIITLVMGLNVVQGLLNPAIDRFKTTSWSKAISMIPGIGNSASAIGEMLVGTGMVIKNSVGVAAMLILVIIGLTPLIKIYVMSFLYKVSSAILEPITDKRIAGSINGVYKGSVLAGKLMLTSLFLFLVTIAMITASTSYVAG